MNKIFVITALISTPLLLNACQSSSGMNHHNMKSDSMMQEEKMMGNDMGTMKQNHDMKKGMM